MYFDNLNELWHMAGHGIYVWSAYGISAVVLIAIIVLPVRSYRKQMEQIRLQQCSSEADKPS